MNELATPHPDTALLLAVEVLLADPQALHAERASSAKRARGGPP
jgi:hypothetical protein